jgi:hypothetical protein
MFSALAAALAFWIFCGLGIDIKTATLAALMLALATPLFAYSAWFFSEPLAAALLLGRRWHFLPAAGSNVEPKWRRWRECF